MRIKRFYPAFFMLFLVPLLSIAWAIACQVMYTYMSYTSADDAMISQFSNIQVTVSGIISYALPILLFIFCRSSVDGSNRTGFLFGILSFSLYLAALISSFFIQSASFYLLVFAIITPIAGGMQGFMFFIWWKNIQNIVSMRIICLIAAIIIWLDMLINTFGYIAYELIYAGNLTSQAQTTLHGISSLSTSISGNIYFLTTAASYLLIYLISKSAAVRKSPL